MLERIVSGGQAGTDRASWDAAIELQIPTFGWVPRGRLAEDGPIPAHYPCQETDNTGYPDRTVRNVRDSDATLILTLGPPGPGTALTIRTCKTRLRPYRVVNLALNPDPAEVVAWLREHQVKVLNCAGSRESRNPGIYVKALVFLRAVLSQVLKQQEVPA